MKDSGDVGTTQNQNGQLVNFQGADLQEEKDGKPGMGIISGKD